MLDNKKIVVVMPAYNAAKTLIKTYNELPIGIVKNYSIDKIRGSYINLYNNM